MKINLISPESLLKDKKEAKCQDQCWLANGQQGVYSSYTRVVPNARASMGQAGRGVAALIILAGVGLIIYGYGQAETAPLYVLPEFGWYLNNALMVPALFFMDAGRTRTITRTKVRHSMLWGIVTWAVAHLLVNGDLASVIMLGGLLVWPFAQMAVINRAEGEWALDNLRPKDGTLSRNFLILGVALMLYAIIAGIHHWLSYSVLTFI